MELKDYQWEQVGLTCWEELILNGIESYYMHLSNLNILLTLILNGIESLTKS